MSLEDGWHDDAAWGCAILVLELNLPVVHLPGESDKNVHQAWMNLATVPDQLRRDYMASHGIGESWWLAWATVARLVANIEGNSNV